MARQWRGKHRIGVKFEAERDVELLKTCFIHSLLHLGSKKRVVSL